MNTTQDNEEVGLINPLGEGVVFSGMNVTMALFKTFKESVEHGGRLWTKKAARKEFANNMQYISPELYNMVFWNGNCDSITETKGLASLCSIFETEATRPLFDKISQHYLWRKREYGDNKGFEYEPPVVFLKI